VGAPVSDLPKSPNDLGRQPEPSSNANNEGEKKEDVNLSDYVPKTDYENLVEKLTEQGGELGDLRKFFNEISPLLEKLHSDPELAEAILDDKINSSLLQDVLSGKINKEDATTMTSAYKEVKKELGDKKLETLNSDAIEELVEKKMQEKMSKVEKDLTHNISEIEEKRSFEKSVESFINTTSDFPEYADAITKWLEDHPDVYDINVAYYAVKGENEAQKAVKDKEKEEAEIAKGNALNASGGGSQGGRMPSQTPTIDDFIGGPSNPNSF